MQWYDALSSTFSIDFSVEQFLRGWLMVITRAFDLEGTRTTLVPGLDSFNHDPNRASARPAPDGMGGMLVAATRDIEAGEEVFFTYSQLSISELYRTYGFTLPLEAALHILLCSMLILEVMGVGSVVLRAFGSPMVIKRRQEAKDLQMCS